MPSKMNTQRTRAGHGYGAKVRYNSEFHLGLAVMHSIKLAEWVTGLAQEYNPHYGMP